MAIDPSSLINNLMLETNATSLAYSISSERNLLRHSYGDIESIAIPALTSEVTLADNTVDVLFVGFNHKPLFPTLETVLNSLTPQWRVRVEPAPWSYIYRSEQPLQTLRLYPTPSIDGTLQVIKLVEPPEGIALWHNAFVALGALARLSAIDPLRARLDVTEIASKLQELLYGALEARSLRSRRR